MRVAVAEGLLVQAALDHPPADQALQAAQGEQPDEARVELLRDLLLGGKVGEGDGKAEADAAAPHAVAPLEVVDRLEVLQVPRAVALGVLREELVPVVVGCGGALAEATGASARMKSLRTCRTRRPTRRL